MNKSNPLISIIVGVYNGEKYLRECLDTIINQSYKNIEIILVNDGSPDNSLKILREYESHDDRIIIIDQKNMGVSISRNNALDICKGEYICIIDQDDCISKDYIEYLYNLINENGAEISLTPTVDKFMTKYTEDKSEDHIQIWTGQKTVQEMLYHKLVIAPWNKMISRKIIDENNIKFNEKFFNGEGFAFSIECFQFAKKVAVGQKKIYHYRVGDPESGASKYKESSVISSITAQTYIKEKLIFDDKETLKSWEFSNWHTHCDNFNMIIGCGAKEHNKDLYYKIKKVCQKDALCALGAPISIQQKFRGILFKISPILAAKIINKFRVRKFKQAK